MTPNLPNWRSHCALARLLLRLQLHQHLGLSQRLRLRQHRQLQRLLLLPLRPRQALPPRR
jgi:hypothetical protein